MTTERNTNRTIRMTSSKAPPPTPWAPRSMSGRAGKCQTPHSTPTTRLAANGVMRSCKSGRANPRQPVFSVTPPTSREIEASKAARIANGSNGTLIHPKLPDGANR
jgi:hypothetical protein